MRLPDRLIPCLIALLLVVFGCMSMGCDTIMVRYGDATYTRATLFSDKSIDDVTLHKRGDALRVEVGSADTATRVELMQAAGALLEAAR